MNKVELPTLRNALGEAVARNQLINWKPADGSGRPFLPVEISWIVNGRRLSLPMRKGLLINVLPDASGFICFEDDRDTDNCYVLDAYGKERYRLRVPWELTPYDVPPGAKMWFRNVGTHMDGQYGVTAWIEYAGDFYFELDYHEGRFLWGKEIRF
ncbi:hypothetical protein [Dyella sp. EPa41]|uniref:hypothetical protein n=1 Tax=Dyella sp. EPa41 TaxID=1561194 RepID=UPI001915F57F|nr:hypothetical protein [Dyella sp. EPa41]